MDLLASTRIRPIGALGCLISRRIVRSGMPWRPGYRDQSMPHPLTFLGDYPSKARVGWHVEAQGVPTNGDSWFISQKDRIWKIPFAHDLRVHVTCHDAEVRCVEITDLALSGYDHFG